MPSKFPCLGQKNLKYNATSPCSNGFLQSFIKLRSHTLNLAPTEIDLSFNAEALKRDAETWRKGAVLESGKCKEVSDTHRAKSMAVG